MYPELVGQLIDINDARFVDFPPSLQGEVYVDGDASSGWVTEQVLTPAQQAERRKAQINAEAYQRIIAIAPEWKQRNWTARSVELLRVGPTSWGPTEQAEADAIQAAWDRITAIRDASNVAIESGNDPVWP